MMERRLIITAEVKKEWTPVRRKQLGTVKNVAGHARRSQQTTTP